jgi:hypothetical protein
MLFKEIIGICESYGQDKVMYRTLYLLLSLNRLIVYILTAYKMPKTIAATQQMSFTYITNTDYKFTDKILDINFPDDR